jgi:DNA-binding response OmpR family regulator
MMSNDEMLIVEDHDATRVALANFFQEKGWSIREAATIADGLASLDPPPRAIVLDLMLPDGGGETILETIRKRGMQTRVAVCTGVFDQERMSIIESMSPDAILMKPVDLHHVFSVFGEADARPVRNGQ